MRLNLRRDSWIRDWVLARPAASTLHGAARLAVKLIERSVSNVDAVAKLDRVKWGWPYCCRLGSVWTALILLLMRLGGWGRGCRRWCWTAAYRRSTIAIDFRQRRLYPVTPAIYVTRPAAQ
jgi:hypothetical protein